MLKFFLLIKYLPILENMNHKLRLNNVFIFLLGMHMPNIILHSKILHLYKILQSILYIVLIHYLKHEIFLIYLQIQLQDNIQMDETKYLIPKANYQASLNLIISHLLIYSWIHFYSENYFKLTNLLK